MDVLLTNLEARARKIAARCGIEIHDDNPDLVGLDDNPAMCFSDPRLEVVEQVCHELAHAVQLDIMDFTKVSGRVSAKIVLMPTKADQDLNEVRCFVIEEEVFWHLGVGLQWMPGDAIAAVEAQVNTKTWTPRKIQLEWTRFAYEALPLATQIANLFKEVA